MRCKGLFYGQCYLETTASAKGYSGLKITGLKVTESPRGEEEEEMDELLAVSSRTLCRSSSFRTVGVSGKRVGRVGESRVKVESGRVGESSLGEYECGGGCGGEWKGGEGKGSIKESTVEI